MSSKKFFSQQRSSSSSRSTTPVNSRSNLNLTSQVFSRGSSSRPHRPQNSNNTIVGSPAIHSALVLDNHSLLNTEAELAYSTYLENVMKKLILQKVVKEKTIQCNDTLASISERVFKLQKEEEELLEQIEDIELSRSVEEGLVKMKEIIKISDEIIDDDFKKCLNDFVQNIRKANNKLYVENVLPLKSEEEYKQFNSLISESCLILGKMIELLGDVKGVEQLAVTLKEIQEEFKEVERKCSVVQQCQEHAALGILEKASDFL